MRSKARSKLRRSSRPAALLLVSILPAAELAARPRPAPLDLVALVECRAGSRDYGALAFKIAGDPDAAKAMGWVAVEQPNPFLREYRLPRAIKVFGHKTAEIAFASAGLLALLDGVAPETLAAKLHLADASPGAGKVMFARTISEEKDDLATTTIRLEVSTVDSHPGKTLAGCEYRVDVH
jgi:hypothetical protein